MDAYEGGYQWERHPDQKLVPRENKKKRMSNSSQTMKRFRRH